MRITIEKKRAEIATSKVCQDVDWENGKIKGNSAFAKTLNTYLHQMELKVHNSHRQLLMRDEYITGDFAKSGSSPLLAEPTT